MADIKALANTLVGLTVKEVNELATELKDVHGIEPAAAAPVMVSGGGGGGEAAPAAVEQTEFKVTLDSSGASKLNVVKVVKELLGLGLKEAKDLVDAAPSTLKESASKDDANNIKTTLEAAGATVSVK